MKQAVDEAMKHCCVRVVRSVHQSVGLPPEESQRTPAGDTLPEHEPAVSDDETMTVEEAEGDGWEAADGGAVAGAAGAAAAAAGAAAGGVAAGGAAGDGSAAAAVAGAVAAAGATTGAEAAAAAAGAARVAEAVFGAAAVLTVEDESCESRDAAAGSGGGSAAAAAQEDADFEKARLESIEAERQMQFVRRWERVGLREAVKATRELSRQELHCTPHQRRLANQSALLAGRQCSEALEVEGRRLAMQRQLEREAEEAARIEKATEEEKEARRQKEARQQEDDERTARLQHEERMKQAGVAAAAALKWGDEDAESRAAVSDGHAAEAADGATSVAAEEVAAEAADGGGENVDAAEAKRRRKAERKAMRRAAEAEAAAQELAAQECEQRKAAKRAQKEAAREELAKLAAWVDDGISVATPEEGEEGLSDKQQRAMLRKDRKRKLAELERARRPRPGIKRSMMRRRQGGSERRRGDRRGRLRRRRHRMQPMRRRRLRRQRDCSARLRRGRRRQPLRRRLRRQRLRRHSRMRSALRRSARKLSRGRPRKRSSALSRACRALPTLRAGWPATAARRRGRPIAPSSRTLTCSWSTTRMEAGERAVTRTAGPKTWAEMIGLVCFRFPFRWS